MIDLGWIKELPVAIIVCDTQGFILEMNDRALEFNQRQGSHLIGTNMIDCHPTSIQPLAKQLIDEGKIHTNIFERGGNTYMSYYTPWYLDGNYNGLIEFIMEIPSHEKHLFKNPNN